MDGQPWILTTRARRDAYEIVATYFGTPITAART